MFITCLSSCKKEEDASILIGTWKSAGEPVIEVITNDEDADGLIEKEIRRLCTDNTLTFLDDGTFEQTYTDESGRQVYYLTGTYARKNGELSARYYVSGIFNTTVLYLSASTDDTNHLTVYQSATDQFNNQEYLPTIGIDDPAGITVSMVSFTMEYTRQ